MNENKKIDLRIRRTQKLLIEALTKLLKEKDFENISVTEICDSAMINRTTFYKHYTDKYDLAQRGMKELLNDLSKKISTPIEKILVDKSGKAPYHFIYIFQHIFENEAFYRLVLTQYSSNILRKTLVNWFVERSILRLEHIKLSKGHLPLEVVTHFSIGGLFELIEWWIENDFPYTPEEMADYIFEIYKDFII